MGSFEFGHKHVHIHVPSTRQRQPLYCYIERKLEESPPDVAFLPREEVKYLLESVRRTPSCDGLAGPSHIVQIFKYVDQGKLQTYFKELVEVAYGKLDESLVTMFAIKKGSNVKFYGSYNSVIDMLFRAGLLKEIWDETGSVKNIKASCLYPFPP